MSEDALRSPLLFALNEFFDNKSYSYKSIFLSIETAIIVLAQFLMSEGNLCILLFI